MVSFVVYDLTFLVLFTAYIVWFLGKQAKHPTKKNPLSREGWIFMYRTQAGMKAIDYVGEKFKRILIFLKWPIITIGMILMAVMIWMLGQTLSIYILFPEITKIIKAPPIAPLIPYFPRLFGMQSFFPPFYFTYFIIALAVVAVVHEFSHGIYMKLFKVKIKSTGLVFLGPILGAFVEQDEKSFKKKKNTEQMAILAAGVFANLLFALIFYLLYVAFFFSAFTQAGYTYNTYGVEKVALEDIRGFEEVGNNLTRMYTESKDYYLDENLAIQLTQSGTDFIYAYSDSPAVKSQMRGVIIQADDTKIMNQETLREFMENKNPGDRVRIKTKIYDETYDYDFELTTHPEDPTRAYLGVGTSINQPRGIIQGFLKQFMSFREPTTYYEPKGDGNFVIFIFDLLWWVMVINLLVALFNMMPLGMLDGGRFFYLTILSITKNEKFSKRMFKLSTYAIIFVFLLLMFFWFIRII